MPPAPYEPPEEEIEQTVSRISIRLEKAEADVLHGIAELWQELDAELGRKRRYKWTAASVMERMIRVGVADFWAQIGGSQKENESRGDFIKRAALAAKKHRKSEPPK